jgi:Protein kinase domain
MLSSGTRLGPYEILSALGAGGMGEVYKARDTRLDRFVAVKILPAHLADSPELRERFEREARTIAKLNHPHICTLHDIGRQDGTDFLVMEYLEGETLAALIKKGPLPLDQVLRYAVEVSDALDKAHRPRREEVSCERAGETLASRKRSARRVAVDHRRRRGNGRDDECRSAPGPASLAESIALGCGCCLEYCDRPGRVDPEVHTATACHADGHRPPARPAAGRIGPTRRGHFAGREESRLCCSSEPRP